MRSSASAAPVLAVLPGMAALGPAESALFGAGEDICLTQDWFLATERAALSPGDRPRVLVARRGGRPVGLLPMVERASGALEGMTSPYACLFGPCLDPAEDAAGVRAIGAAFGRFCRAYPTARLDALPDGAAWMAPLVAGFRRAGVAAARFDHFGNWHVGVAGQDWDAYLASRPGALRETVRRKLPRALRTLRFELVRDPEAVGDAVRAYHQVESASWKGPEPFPDFNATLIHAAAASGTLRLTLLHAADRPAAAQIWVVHRGVATVLKLVHDEAFAALSPGTALTALTVRGLLAEGVQELDFGRGDDGYKRLWAGERRQRIGLLLANLHRPAGVAQLLRHRLGQARRSVRGRLGAGTEVAHAHPV